MLSHSGKLALAVVLAVGAAVPRSPASSPDAVGSPDAAAAEAAPPAARAPEPAEPPPAQPNAPAAPSIAAPTPPQDADAMGELAASRLLTQATFGPTLDSIGAAAAESYDRWFADQAAIGPGLYASSVPDDQTNWYRFWLKHAVTGEDQLRQRVAFALSEILVVSNNGGPLVYQSKSLAAYYDILVRSALGNFRTLLDQVTLSMQMGQYLSMFRNDRPDPRKNTHADENYAREVMQLFTIGLVQLNLDGSEKLDPAGRPVPTYTQADVEALARVFTGWGSTPTTHGFGEQSWDYDVDYYHPMIPYSAHHDTGSKTIIGGVHVPGGSAAAELKIALDTLFNHPNVGPFIGKQLIQRLVSSNPSPAYVARVAAAFNDDGHGVRGDLLAVVEAILSDPEAREFSESGKLREPLLRLTGLWRAFAAADARGEIAEYLVIQNSELDYGEAPLQAPSVFNFFRPDYERSGPLSAHRLKTPELQIINENTLVRLDDQLTWQGYAFIDSRGTKHAGYQGYQELDNLRDSSVLLRTAQWEPYAASPSTLVDKLGLVLMQGHVSAAMRSVLIKYAEAIPAAEPWNRVAETAELIVTSPQYAVQP